LEIQVDTKVRNLEVGDVKATSLEVQGGVVVQGGVKATGLEVQGKASAASLEVQGEVRAGNLVVKDVIKTLGLETPNAIRVGGLLAQGQVQAKGDVQVGGTLTVANDIVLTSADCAEEFDIEASTEVEPGTVMVLEHDGTLRQSSSAYDKRVAGVISGGGDYKPGIILDKQQVLPNRKPVALVGKVYCKADAHYASIEVGDLLTTSDTPGHAMKAVDPLRAFGSVIGKALRPLKAGQSMIPILIALQ
jgi:cytoskeletal protein CcmA (bactofilin family)